MAKEIKAVVKVQIEAGKANPAPPVGPALAQHGLNIAEFCKAFNDATKDKMGYTIPAEVTIYKDRSYDFKLKTPLASQLLKEMAQMKLPDLNTTDIEQAMKVIAGTAKNMGIEVKG